VARLPAATPHGLPADATAGAVQDLRAAFGLAPAGPGARPTVAVETAAGLAGLLVDEVLGLVGLSGEDIRPLPAPYEGVERGWFEGLAVLDGSLLVLLRPAGLLGPPGAGGGPPAPPRAAAPPVLDVPPAARLAVFALGGCPFALPAAHILEIVPPGPCTRLPCPDPTRLGVLLHRGAIVALLDPGPALGGSAIRGSPALWVVTRTACGLIALPADAFLGIQTREAQAWREATVLPGRLAVLCPAAEGEGLRARAAG